MRAAKVFNGTFTIRNRETGEYRTFQIRTQPEDADFAPGKRVVSLLTGPDNTSSYTGFGFIDDRGIHVWNARKATGHWNAYAMMLWHIATRTPHPRLNIDGYDLMSEERCLVCNRKLTTPESIETGIGPICAGR